MDYKILNCDSVVKKIIKKDSLFHGNYCADPYQNCEFGCHYCDSSLEKTIYIKTNVADTLKKELEDIHKGRIILGSVHDPYQNAEKKYKLTRTILGILKEFNFPCHILTKSPLILRDIDLLSQIECMITISISSLDDQVVRIFEPEVPSPNDRLQTIQTLRNQGINTGFRSAAWESCSPIRRSPAASTSSRTSRTGSVALGVFVIPLAVQWWSVWYPGSEPGGGGYVAQRMLAARSEGHAQGATLLFNVAHYALRPWPWILVALASLVVFPDVASLRAAFPTVDPQVVRDDLAYPAMLTFRPTGLLGLVVASLAAAYMSTISTHLNWGSSYLVHDLVNALIEEAKKGGGGDNVTLSLALVDVGDKPAGRRMRGGARKQGTELSIALEPDA